MMQALESPPYKAGGGYLDIFSLQAAYGIEPEWSSTTITLISRPSDDRKLSDA